MAERSADHTVTSGSIIVRLAARYNDVMRGLPANRDCGPINGVRRECEVATFDVGWQQSPLSIMTFACQAILIGNLVDSGEGRVSNLPPRRFFFVVGIAATVRIGQS